jgi:hypothetical protein
MTVFPGPSAKIRKLSGQFSDCAMRLFHRSFKHRIGNGSTFGPAYKGWLCPVSI